MMRSRNRIPSHPGEIIKEHYLDPLSLSITEAADSLGVSRKTLSKIVNKRGSITPEMALRLSKAFRTTPELWMNLQQAYDLWYSYHHSKAWGKVRPIAA